MGPGERVWNLSLLNKRETRAGVDPKDELEPSFAPPPQKKILHVHLLLFACHNYINIVVDPPWLPFWTRRSSKQVWSVAVRRVLSAAPAWLDPEAHLL